MFFDFTNSIENGKVETDYNSSLSIVPQKSRRKVQPCAVCLAPAIYSYVGAIVCSPCKVFFMRNAANKNRPLKCHFDERCEINTNNRHVCAFCRLNKCFSVGMQIELFRGTKVKLANSNESRQIQQLPRMNLLRSDQSQLNHDQWTLLSNLVHIYDEKSDTELSSKFLQEQNGLPIKCRFKVGPVNEYFQSILTGFHLFYDRNGDFISLTRHDQSLLLQNTFKQVAGLTTCFVVGRSHLYEDEAFHRTISSMYSPSAITHSTFASTLFDPDIVIVKLFLSMMMFSTLDSTYFMQRNFDKLDNIRLVQQIQDRYAEIAWKYLLYRYDIERAVKSFSNFIRCVFADVRSLISAAEMVEFDDVLNDVFHKTEHSLNIRDDFVVNE